MSFDSTADALEPEARAILLSNLQFEIVFQITHQLPNFEESRLLELGVTPHDLQDLIAELQVIRDHLRDSLEVKISLYEADVFGTSRPASADGATSGIYARGWMPTGIVTRWGSLMELVVSALSPRELFLRTGYEYGEIRDAINRLKMAHS